MLFSMNNISFVLWCHLPLLSLLSQNSNLADKKTVALERALCTQMPFKVYQISLLYQIQIFFTYVLGRAVKTLFQTMYCATVFKLVSL